MAKMKGECMNTPMGSKGAPKGPPKRPGGKR